MLRFQEAFLLGCALILTGLGLLTLHAIAPSLALRQAVWAGLALGLYTVARSLSPRALNRLAWLGYALHLLLLMAVLAVGQGPVHRWLNLGVASYQPSEGMKAVLILLLPQMVFPLYAENLLRGAAFTGLPALLVAMEPDLATAGVMGLVALVQIYLAGLSLRFLLLAASLPLLLLTVVIPWFFWVILATGSLVTLLASLGRGYWLFYASVMVLGGVLTPVVWNRALKPYQRERIIRFFKSSDPQASWQAYQAEIAVGSGGFLGKGYGRGTQKALRFLPAAHTDFVFSAFAEEWGFVGSALVFLLFGLLIWNLISWGSTLPDPRHALVLQGIAAFFLLHAGFNLAMNLRVFPVAGLPLPFMSYGGSHLLAEFALLGVAQAHFRATWKK